MVKRNYLDLILNPLELLRTKKVLHVNPTIEPERIEPDEIKIIVYEFNKDSYECITLNSVEDCYRFLNTTSVTWINVDGLKKGDVEKICIHFGIHQLITEDILSIGQRPKMDDVNGLVFCLLYMLYFNEPDSAVETEQISVILGKNFVISFQEDEKKDVFNSLRDKLKVQGSKVRQSGSDFLYYSLIDLIVDHFYVVMEKLGEKIEDLEEDILRNPGKKSLVKINMLRKEMIVLKRSIAPVREIINGILRSENELIEERTAASFEIVSGDGQDNRTNAPSSGSPGSPLMPPTESRQTGAVPVTSFRSKTGLPQPSEGGTPARPSVPPSLAEAGSTSTYAEKGWTWGFLFAAIAAFVGSILWVLRRRSGRP